jgi:hypothetical protein
MSRTDRPTERKVTDMTTMATTKNGKRSASPAQVRYLRDLMARRGEWLKANDTPETQIENLRKAWRAAPTFNADYASSLIGALLELPSTASSSFRSAERLVPGVYICKGNVYRVYTARSGGQMLAAQITETGPAYQGLAVHFGFRLGDRVTDLAELARYGRQFGYCCECGRLLTDPSSVQAGIGPICAGKY